MEKKTARDGFATKKVPGSKSFVFKKKFAGSIWTVLDGVVIGDLDGFVDFLWNRTEPDVPQANLKLKKVETPDIGNLPEIAFAHFWKLVKKQGRGQAGALVTDDSYQTIARIRGDNDMPLLVSARWESLIDVDMGGWTQGWCFKVFPIEKLRMHKTIKSCTTVSY